MAPFSARTAIPLGLALAWTFILLSLTGAADLAPASVSSAPSQATAVPQASPPMVFLPVVIGPPLEHGDFRPTQDVTLPPGEHHFQRLEIPDGITVTLAGGAVLQIREEAILQGTVRVDCGELTIRAGKGLTITGTVDNRCADPQAEPGPLRLLTTGRLALGTPQSPPNIHTSGDLEISDAPDVPAWEFDLPPDARAPAPLPPACSLRPESVAQPLPEEGGASFVFHAQGLDPDGGPVTFAWDFGDGHTMGSGGEDQTTHVYTEAGLFTAKVTGTDDEGTQCTATAQVLVYRDPDRPLAPALALDPLDLVIPMGEEVGLLYDVFSLVPGDLSVHWDFGDHTVSTVPTATHAYTSAGLYTVTLTATDVQGAWSQVQARIYVHPPIEEAPVNSAAATQFCAAPPPQFVPIHGLVLPDTGPGRDGRSVRFRINGHAIIMPGVRLKGGDGGNAPDRVGNGFVMARRGGNGGSVIVTARGMLVVCAGVILEAGDGGNGGNATANPGMVNGSPMAWAVGGRGGRPGRQVWLGGGQGVLIEGNITMDGGDGGHGGNATANPGHGGDGCPAQDGAPARARGGNGGDASKRVIVRGRVVGANLVRPEGGRGGNGGDARAVAGNGGDNAPVCNGPGRAGQGGWAKARSGRGGDGRLVGAVARIQPPPAGRFRGGNSGDATAIAGHGGDGASTSPACQPAEARGGHGGQAEAEAQPAGQGFMGRNGTNGDAQAQAGNGGAATAIARDCDQPCQNGGNALAIGGNGGGARAQTRRPGGGTAKAGQGGNALAQGGRGADCNDCSAPAGGAGGNAEALAGDGGNALAAIAEHGQGGQATATGGDGGKGADCDCQPGGDGGTGGDARSVGGRDGDPPGARQPNHGRAGNGGDGGNGLPPGSGGEGGVGTGEPNDLPDGVAGADGERMCMATPTPTATVTPSPTAIASTTPTATATPSPTAIASTTPPPPTGTLTPTATASATPPPPTGTLTPSPTAIASATPPPPTGTLTPSPTATASATPPPPTGTLTPTATASATPPPPTRTLTPSPTATASATPPPPTGTLTPTATNTAIPSPTTTLTATPLPPTR